MNWDKLPELLKIETRYWVGATLVSGTILFAPDALAVTIGIDALRAIMRPYLGFFFIVTIGVAIVQIGTKVFEGIKKKRDQSKAMKVLQDRLHKLTQDEKRILCGYILTDCRTQYFSVEDGVVTGLEQAKVIYRASSVGDLYGKGFAFNIQPWAWEYLKDRKELITKGVPRDEQGRVIKYENPFNRLYY